MKETTVTFETSIPEDVYSALRARGLGGEKLAEETRRLLALRFFKEHVLSLGQAARLAGMSRWDFIEFLSKNDVPVIDFDEEELAQEFAAADRLSWRLRQK
ncbi:MAG: UPF0175 family protein [Chloroflexi bacterium]|nr:UPF0175 family protein [Chloroflexota bacterium]